MSEIDVYNPIKQFLQSSNELGDVYLIPNNIGFKIDYDLIMETFIHCEIKHTYSGLQIIVIHKGAIQRGRIQ